MQNFSAAQYVVCRIAAAVRYCTLKFLTLVAMLVQKVDDPLLNSDDGSAAAVGVLNAGPAVARALALRDPVVPILAQHHHCVPSFRHLEANA